METGESQQEFYDQQQVIEEGEHHNIPKRKLSPSLSSSSTSIPFPMEYYIHLFQDVLSELSPSSSTSTPSSTTTNSKYFHDQILKPKLIELSSQYSLTSSSKSSAPSADSYDILKSKLCDLSSQTDSFIYRAPHLRRHVSEKLRQVSERVRQVNESAFVPQIILIGPYHRGDNYKYQTMERRKARYLKDLLERQLRARPDSDQEEILNGFITESQDTMEKARKCYVGNLDMISSSADFVAMMVLDGLFVVELLRKFHDRKLRRKNDDLFKQNMNLTIVAQDLLLLENQLPFFVLEHFSEKTKLSSNECLISKAIHFFTTKVPELRRRDDGGRPRIRDIKHLLDLVHNHCLSSPDQESNIPIVDDESDDQEEEVDSTMGVNFVRSATELYELGIRFKKRDEGNSSLFDIKFERGKMHIPTLKVDHDTERIFRNLIAFEQFNQGPSIVMDYARLMDCLINYADDVALLCDYGIIDNRLGTNEDVANIFNKLNDYVHWSTANFYYSQLFVDVNEHRRWNLWKVKLRKKYFHGPWDWVLTSIIVASILLLLSFLQTLFSVLSYYK